MDRMGVPYKRMEAEAAFYGPKIDVKLIDGIISCVDASWLLADGQRRRPGHACAHAGC